MERKRKTLDCVKMQHRGAEAVRRATEGMTREEEPAYWRRGTAELVDLQKKLREQNAEGQSLGSPPGGV